MNEGLWAAFWSAGVLEYQLFIYEVNRADSCGRMINSTEKKLILT